MARGYISPFEVLYSLGIAKAGDRGIGGFMCRERKVWMMLLRGDRVREGWGLLGFEVRVMVGWMWDEEWVGKGEVLIVLVYDEGAWFLSFGLKGGRGEGR